MAGPIGRTLYWSGPGDSGAPVFVQGAGDQVTLVGIHWGANNSAQFTVFSPLGGIHQDFGDEVITHAPAPTVTMDGPRVAGRNEYCTWTANVSGGTSPYSYDWKRSGVDVGSSQTYHASTGTSSFYLQVGVTDSHGQTAGAGGLISVTDTTGVCLPYP